MSPVPSAPGPNPSLVNVAGESGTTASFDTVDRIRFARRLQPPYNYSVSEAVPNVDVQDLQIVDAESPTEIYTLSLLDAHPIAEPVLWSEHDPVDVALAQVSGA